jgi:biopolymer transport protein TolR
VKPRTYHALSEINVTNLVDVVLVLLIIFMITAPLLQSGIEVRLPPTTAAAEETSEGIWPRDPGAGDDAQAGVD